MVLTDRTHAGKRAELLSFVEERTTLALAPEEEGQEQQDIMEEEEEGGQALQNFRSELMGNGLPAAKRTAKYVWRCTLPRSLTD